MFLSLQTEPNPSERLGDDRREGVRCLSWVACDVGVSFGDPCNPASSSWSAMSSCQPDLRQQKNTNIYVVQHDVPMSMGMRRGVCIIDLEEGDYTVVSRSLFLQGVELSGK